MNAGEIGSPFMKTKPRPNNDNNNNNNNEKTNKRKWIGNMKFAEPVRALSLSASFSIEMAIEMCQEKMLRFYTEREKKRSR